MDYFTKLFDTDGFPPRWYCGTAWADDPSIGWVHIISDLVTWLAYLAIPCVLAYFILKREEIVFPRIFWLFAVFILACGMVHLVEAIIFWSPMYRLSGLFKLVTAIASSATVVALIRIAPEAMKLPGLAEVNAKLSKEVSEREQAEQTLRDTNEDLEGFTFIASHDLQEPLRNVLAYADLLVSDLGEELTDDAREDLKFITDSSRRMQRLIDDLLAFSRAGQYSLNREKVSLEGCLDEALELLQSRIEETGSTIVRRELPTIEADRTLMAHLFQNLIGNAIKFAGDDSPEIEITAVNDDGIWTIGVKDNGIGIKAEYQEQVFLPFKRLHGMSEYVGSGVGLAICKKIVERHGGKIWVESSIGEGSHFRFTMSAS